MLINLNDIKNSYSIETYMAKWHNYHMIKIAFMSLYLTNFCLRLTTLLQKQKQTKTKNKKSIYINLINN